MALFNGAFAGRRVLITGHTGFKGSWLAIWLRELGAHVKGYALAPRTERDNYVLSGLADKLDDTRGDVRDFAGLTRAFDDFQPEIVFHLAAQAIVRTSYDEPKETYDVNVGGTVNVLEAVRGSKSVKVLVNVTSDKCYENREWVWGYRENDPLGGYDPYSSSKGCAELVTAAYRSSFFNPRDRGAHGKSVASVRAGNVIGGGDWSACRIVPDCIRALQKGEPVLVRNPHAIRPWQHVLEPLAGYLWLAAKMLEDGAGYAEPWNFGPGDEACISVGDLAAEIVKLWGAGSWVPGGDGSSRHEATFLRLDCNKARTYLGWKPCLTIAQALALTVDWYKRYERMDVYRLCLEQISHYVECAAAMNQPWSRG
ncbi:MAG: CDP-glucose 4,6-dehydratase [Bacteroidota bacterium]